MKKHLKKILLALLAVLVIIQFFRPEKNRSAAVAPILTVDGNAAPLAVQTVLQTSCYDCHSNNTIYPWYAEVQPVAWWLNHHVEEGKEELNFDAFNTYSLRRQFRKLQEIGDQLKEDEMPLGSYTIIHRDAILSPDQKALISGWVQSMIDSLRAHYPADSLQRPKH